MARVGTGATILVAEPSATIGDVVRRIFQDAGYRVTLVHDGLTALDRVVRESPALLAAGRSLGDISGFQLCGIVKEGLEESAPPVVLYRVDDLERAGDGDYSPPDAQVSLEDGGGELQRAVESLLADRAPRGDGEGKGSPPPPEGYAAARCAAEVLDKELELAGALKLVCRVAMESAMEPAAMAEGLLEGVCELLGCQVAALSLNQQAVRLYHLGTGRLGLAEFQDFCRVCMADFEAGFPEDCRLDWEAAPYKEVAGEPLHLTSYRHFALRGNRYIGALHIASARRSLFSPRKEKMIGVLVDGMTLFLGQALDKEAGELERLQLKSTLSKFVPKEIIDDLVKGGPRSTLLANEMRRVSILFCDIRNFTTFCEDNRPEQVVSFLNNYFTTMVDIIKRHGGSIDKFIGDAIMAIFGAPVSYEDNERRAVAAALEMRRAFPEMQEYGRRFLNVPSIDFGIGIHCGNVIVGNIGCQDKTNYTVIGDSVNIAFRLEGITKAYHVPIIISQTVRDVLGDEFHFHPVDTVNVKGKSVRMPIYRVDDQELPAAYRENYQKALDLYLAGAWGRAADYFDAAHRSMPHGSGNIMARRCRDFVSNPPASWEGTYVFTTK